MSLNYFGGLPRNMLPLKNLGWIPECWVAFGGRLILGTNPILGSILGIRSGFGVALLGHASR